MAPQEQTTIAFVLYPGTTLLDLVGPLQVFSVLRDFDDRFQRWWWPSGPSPCRPTRP